MIRTANQFGDCHQNRMQRPPDAQTIQVMKQPAKIGGLDVIGEIEAEHVMRMAIVPHPPPKVARMMGEASTPWMN